MDLGGVEEREIIIRIQGMIKKSFFNKVGGWRKSKMVQPVGTR